MKFKIVSGGQTGVDRAGLEAAIALGLPYGGWVPKGRLAEDGVVPLKYVGMQEHTSSNYAVRTKANVRDSDATLIIAPSLPLSGGTMLTLRTQWMRRCDGFSRFSRLIGLLSLTSQVLGNPVRLAYRKGQQSSFANYSRRICRAVEVCHGI